VITSIALGTFIGITLGLISGLVPGIHANTMAGALLSLQPLMITGMDAETLAAAMFAALITHTFLDIIPSTFLGIPDADTAVSVLPAHALCLEGRGEEAVRISALGSAAATVIGVPLCVAGLFILPILQPAVDWGIGIILLAVLGFLIVMSDSPGWAGAVFGASGVLGIFVFRHSYLAWNMLGETSLLMPLLSGLFGIPVLLVASRGLMPEQEFHGIGLDRRSICRSSLLGTAAGALVGWLPGLSNATANALLTSVIGYDTDRGEYILATSAANTANAFLCLAALYALSRTRNGVMVALSLQELPPMTALILCGVVSAFIAYLITVYLASYAQKIAGFDVKKLNFAVIIFVSLLSLLLCGPFGILILVLATVVGAIPHLVNVRRVFCMGAVVVPVMLYAWGIAVF